ncbi:MAG: acyl-CoA dehydratase activase [Candidatus Woesearchaeota archaeon]
MKIYLGIDVGSVSTNVIAMDENYEIKYTTYIRTHGNPLKSVQKGLKIIEDKFKEEGISPDSIIGVGVTGSARYLISAMVNADIVKNEITAHAISATQFYPDIKTIIEIGGQDSKIILLDNGIVTDFAMNNVCAAGTGSFLDQQSTRLGIPIEDFGRRALESTNEVRIAGRCTVFAESDMIHKQQLGYTINDIINGLCEALVRNYFSTVAKGKNINEPIIFQGGVAANVGIIRAFNKHLKKEVIIPKHYSVMGAIGSAILAKDFIEKTGAKTKFKGFEIKDFLFKTTSFTCKDCANHCEVIEFWQDNKKIALFGDKCGKYNNTLNN